MPISPTSLDGVEFGSKAEKDILLAARNSQLFKNDFTWLYYSLKINETGNAKIIGESDFVYLDSTHLLFLEVKGGEVKFDSINNRWHVMGGAKEKDPFKQCSSLMFQVRDVLLPRLFDTKKISERLIFGYGTMFPESIKPKELNNHVNGTIEYHSDIIYDCFDYVAHNGFVRYIDKLKAFWTDRHSHKNYFMTGISSKEQKTISEYFRVNLHFELPPAILVEKEKISLKHFTSYQSYVLDNVELNRNSGGIILGGPGTGKTLLATELAIQKATNNKTVLFICFNKFLAAYLNTTISHPSVKITHLHGLYSELSNSSDWQLQNEDIEKYFDELLPLSIIKILESRPAKKYDYLIIDEGQDLLNEYHFDILNNLLVGGFNSGKWVMFMDILGQNIYNKRADEYFEYFRTTFPCFINKLTTNCRNTKNIIEFSHLLTKLPVMPCLRTDNYYKCHAKYGDTYQSILSQIKTEIDLITGEGTELKRNITILCYSKEQIELIKRSALNAVTYETGSDNVTVSTIQGFKGLENSYIYILGPDNYYPDDNVQMSVLYVGVTRATTKCVVYFLDSNKESVLSQAEKSTS